MNSKPIPPQVDMMPPEDEAEYDRWFRKKIATALADPRPSVSHEQVVAEMKQRFKAMRKKAKPGKTS